METRRRTVLKAVLWNLLGLATGALAGPVATGALAPGEGMALADAALGLASGVLDERLRARIAWGRA